MTAFYNATVELGVANKVTAFTASDFGRTWPPTATAPTTAGAATTSWWAARSRARRSMAHRRPVSVGNTSAPNDQWHVGQGRLLPSTSVDQYAATLARGLAWPTRELAGILPNLGHFGAAAPGRPDYPIDLGFMR
jgi:uncharacterized protein (DUF1501 family)